MLDSIRKRKDNWISVSLILAVVAVMAFFGVSKFDKNAQNGSSPAAFVNGEVITQREFGIALENTLQQYKGMFGGQVDEKLLAALQIPQRTLERLVQYKVVTQQAKKIGVYVSDSELADSIRSQPYFQKDGKFDAELYSKVPNRGLEEHRMRDQMIAKRAEDFLTERVRLTPAEIRKGVLLKNTLAELEIAAIDFPALAPKSPANSKQLEEFTKATPEADLKDYYENHKADYTEKAQVELKQIRVAVPYQAKDDTRAAAHKKADEILAQLAKSPFEDVAKKSSDDEYAKKGGLRGWVVRGTLEKPLEEALDKMKPGDTSNVVETPYGFFILKMVSQKDAVVKPFETVKADVVAKMYESKAKNTFGDNKRKEWEQALKDGKSLDAELKKNKIELKKTGAFSLGGGNIPTVGSNDAMLDAVFELTKEKPIAPKLFFFHDKYYYVKLVSLTLPKESELGKEQENFEKTLNQSLQGQIISQWVQGLQKQATVKTELKFDKTAPSAEL